MGTSLQDDPYRRDLAQADLASALQYLAKCSLQVWRSSPQGSLHRHSEVVQGVTRVSKPYALVHLAYLASEIIANARGTGTFGLEEFDAGIEFIDSSDTIAQEFKTTNVGFRGIQILLSSAYPQITIADGTRVINRFGRYCLLFNEIGTRESTGSMPSFISGFPDFMCGLQVQQFMVAGIVVFALALMRQGKIELSDLIDVKIGPVLVTKDLVNRFLAAITVDPDAFRHEMNRTGNYSGCQLCHCEERFLRRSNLH